MTRVLVTGGAGYVGSVSAAAFVEAGHDVVVLDDLTTGHRAAVPPGATFVQGTYVDGPALARTPRSRSGSRRSCTAPRARSSASRSSTRPGTSARTWPAASPCSMPPERPGSGGSCSRPPRRSTGRPTRRRSPRTPRSGRSIHTARSKRAFESAMAWYGRAYGLRSVALRYFNVAGATATLGEDHDARDAPDPQPPARHRRGHRGDDLRRRLPDAGRDLHPRLHPRVGPGRGPSAGARCHRARRPANRRAARLQPGQRWRLLGPRGDLRDRAGDGPSDPVPRRATTDRRSARPGRSRRSRRRDPRLAAGATRPRGDGRVSLGLAAGPSPRLRDVGEPACGWTAPSAAPSVRRPARADRVERPGQAPRP